MANSVKDTTLKSVVREEIENGAVEYVIREGAAKVIERPLDVKLSGTLNAPFLYLDKRIGVINALNSHIVVDREKMTITLTVDEHEPILNRVAGSLSFHPMFKKLKINSGEYLTTHEMADLFKMNRMCFENMDVAMGLVSALKNFKAKIDKNLENSNNDRGNKSLIFQQTVESNIPESFKLNIPIFKGMDKEIIEVEVYIRAEDLACTLVSAQANDFIEQIRDSAIDQVLNEISAVAPHLLIIEQ